MTEFTEEECWALFMILDDVSGGNINDIFRWDGNDNPEDADIRAAAKLFKACDQEVPDNL